MPAAREMALALGGAAYAFSNSGRIIEPTLADTF